MTHLPRNASPSVIPAAPRVRDPALRSSPRPWLIVFLVGAILSGTCLRGTDAYAVLPVNGLHPTDFLAVPSTCEGVTLTNTTFPAADPTARYREFVPDGGASPSLFSRLFFLSSANDRGVFESRPAADGCHRTRLRRAAGRAFLVRSRVGTHPRKGHTREPRRQGRDAYAPGSNPLSGASGWTTRTTRRLVGTRRNIFHWKRAVCLFFVSFFQPSPSLPS